MRYLLPLLVLSACAASSDADDPAPTEPVRLEDRIERAALMAHLEALQAVADANGGNRAAGTTGFDASVDYAVGVLEAAGYDVVVEPFSYAGWQSGDPVVLEIVGDPASFVDGTDVAAMAYSNGGDVTGPLVAVDLVLPPTDSSSSTSGCEASDFDGFPSGAVALVQRGTCLFQDKALNAQAAGASAMVLFNEGQAGRTALEPWTLEPDGAVTIPVVAARFAVGEALAAALDAGPVDVHIASTAGIVEETAVNVLAETVGDPDRTLVVGGHLDSVPAGPGINDNGSGSALVLELAVQAAAAGWQPENRVRFALWGSEEVGLLGSSAHVDALGASEKDGILANLNFDMVASPNGSAMVYDGDGDDFGIGGPDGSDAIEALFRDWYDREQRPLFPTFFDGRSDYFAFIESGIPAGGLFSGAEGLLTAEEADVTGGQVGAPRDGCYHQECDTLENIDPVLFVEMARSAASVTQALGESGLRGADLARQVPEAGRFEAHGCHGASGTAGPFRR